MWYVILFCYLSVPIFQHGSRNSYFFVFFLICIGIWKNKFLVSKHFSFYSMAFIVIWIYGILVGVMEGNQLVAVLSNFFGMICYAFYYSIPRNAYSEEKMVVLVTRASIIANILALISFVLADNNVERFFPLDNFKYYFSTKSILSEYLFLGFPLESISVYYIFSKKYLKDKIVWLLMLSLSLYTTIYTTGMDGFKLGFLLILSLSLYGVIITIKTHIDKNIYIFMFLLFLIIFFCSTGMLEKIFSLQDIGNMKRWSQLPLVFNRFSLFGNGAGAMFDYTLNGRRFVGYAVEISYLNLIDKYGCLSFILFYIYYKTIMLPIENLKRGIGNPAENFISIGLMGYLAVALGNPVILSNYAVVLHCLSLYFSRKGRIIKESLYQ